MSSQTDNLPVLPLENLPERVMPPPKPYTAYVLEISGETQRLLDECDWKAYEKSIVAGLRETVKRYRKALLTEKIYQVSIATDPQRQVTEISLETKAHAQEHVRRSAKWSRERGLSDMAEKLEKAGYNANPADFLHSGHYTILHRELKPLDGIDYSNNENRKAADAWIEIALLEVVERIGSLKLLSDLPQEEAVWLGVSSPHGWYDRVTRIKGQP